MNDITQQGQLADIARDYYLSQLTITQLSEKYQLSRYLITKALNEARAAGIVRITINSPIDRNTELETRFAELFPHTNTMIIKDAATTNADIENIIDQYLTTVKPMHDAFIEPSKVQADIIVPRGGQNDIATDMLGDLVEHYSHHHV